MKEWHAKTEKIMRSRGTNDIAGINGNKLAVITKQILII